MVANNQLSFYNIEDYVDMKQKTFTYFELCLFLKFLNKRVHYDIPTYKKEYSNDIHQDGTVKDDSVWTRMHQTYKAVAHWVPIDLMGEGEEFEYNGLGVWNDIYKAEPFEHQNQRFMGQEFRDRFAEIIGTERLDIEVRLKVHEELLTLLRNGMSLEESVKKALQTIRKEDFMR